MINKKFEELYPELSPSLHVKQTYTYVVAGDNIDEDIGNKAPSDDIISQNGDSNLHNVELPQHHNVNKEGTIDTNLERITYTKLRNVTSQLFTAVLYDKAQCNNALIYLTEWLRKNQTEGTILTYSYTGTSSS